MTQKSVVTLAIDSCLDELHYSGLPGSLSVRWRECGLQDDLTFLGRKVGEQISIANLY